MQSHNHTSAYKQMAIVWNKINFIHYIQLPQKSKIIVVRRIHIFTVHYLLSTWGEGINFFYSRAYSVSMTKKFRVRFLILLWDYSIMWNYSMIGNWYLKDCDNGNWKKRSMNRNEWKKNIRKEGRIHIRL